MLAQIYLRMDRVDLALKQVFCMFCMLCSSVFVSVSVSVCLSIRA